VPDDDPEVSGRAGVEPAAQVSGSMGREIGLLLAGGGDPAAEPLLEQLRPVPGAAARAEPLDSVFGAAFNAHQRRIVGSDSGSRRLLGPDAGAAAEQAFAERGAVTQVRSSPWRLGPDTAGREWAELTEEWLRGWIAAACEQQPDLAAVAADYLRRRLSACAAGELRAVVGHVDVLALPGPPPGGGTP